MPKNKMNNGDHKMVPKNKMNNGDHEIQWCPRTR